MTDFDLEIQGFVAAHPDGWSHEDWSELLTQLTVRKVKVPNQDEVGMRLEEARLHQVLTGLGVKGLGPKRVAAIVQRYGQLWNLRQATIADLASVPNIPQQLAEETLARLAM